MRTKILMASAAFALTAASAGAVSASTIVLNFDALNGSVNEGPASYYAGGLGSAGTGPGPNYGITFSANTITGCEASSSCANTNANEAPSSPNLIFFISGGADTMDVAGGFDTGFSFYYTSPFSTGVVNVWSGLDATGTLLATLNLPTTPQAGDAGCNGFAFCPFLPFGVNFAGTAMSVDFGGTANKIAFDDITLGSATAGGVPEPASWALMLLGVGGLGASLRGSRRKAALTA